MKKRIISSIMVLAMVLAFIPTTVFAVEKYAPPLKISADYADGKITVTVKAEAYSNCMGAQVDFSFPTDKLSVTEENIVCSGVLESATKNVKTIPTGKAISAAWDDSSPRQSDTEETLMTVTFSVIDGQTGVCNFEIIKYTFTDGDEGEIQVLPAGSIGTTSVTIPKAPITSVTASVKKPEAGKKLDFIGSVDASAPYSITKVEWLEGTNATGTPVTDTDATAKAKQYYYARITLTANPGETFAESLRNGDATPNGYSITRDGDGKLLLTKVYETQSFPAATVTAAPTAKSGLKYDGSEQVLLGFVGEANGGTMRYSLDNSTWSEEIPQGKDAGNYTVYYKVVGDSNHSDSAVASISAKIDPKDISTATIGTIASQSYTGSEITPDPEVKDGTTTLVKDTDYTVSCTDNKYVGTNTAKLTITGTGNYTGTKDAYFTINAIDQTPTFDSPASLVTGGHRLDLRTLVHGAEGDMIFTIASGTVANLEMGNTLVSTGIKGVVTINVTIKAKDVNGDTINEYKEFSRSGAITVNVVDKTSDTTTMTVSQDNITYGGSVSPAVTNKPDGTGTVTYTYEGRDGTTYNSTTAPTNVGKYKVKAKCESSTVIYTAEDTFEIQAKSISGMTVTLDKTSLEYNGSAQTVNVDSVGSLTATDYTVTSGNSGTDVRNYTVTVTGKGNYKDTAHATWQITPAKLTVTPNASQSKKFNEVDPLVLTYTYSGNASGQTPVFTGALNRAAGEDVGNYAIQIGSLALKDNGDFKAANYTLRFAETTVKFEIQKADFPSAVTKTVDILKKQTTAQSGTLTVDDFFTGTIPADAKITAVTPASATMMNNVSVDAATGTLSYTSNTNITATSNEAYTVTITTKNYNNIHATLTFQPTDKDDANVSVTGVPTASVTYGDSFTLNAAATNAGTGTGTWTWSSSDSSVLAVTGNGATATVKVLAAGDATIMVKYESETTVDTETAAITAAKRVISVKADDKSMTVNAALPTFTVTYGNFASGDTANAVFAAEAVASTTADGKTTGTFEITVTAPTLKTEMADKYEVGTPTKGILKVNPKSSGGGSYVPKVQKPEITIIGSGKAELSADGRTATITAAAGHELVSVVLNGKEMGKVEKLTGLKTGDKATITFKAKTDGKAEMDKMIAQKASKLTLMARSAKTAKLNIKVVVKGDLKAITDAGYTVKYKFYRSTKKSAGYKAVLTKKAPTYYNTYGKKGTMYYYKARVMIYDKDGNFVAQTALKQCKYANRLWTK